MPVRVGLRGTPNCQVLPGNLRSLTKAEMAPHLRPRIRPLYHSHTLYILTIILPSLCATCLVRVKQIILIS